MKQRFFDRLMASICGLILFAIAAIVFLWCFGFVPQAWAELLPKMTLTLVPHIIVVSVSLVVMLIGLYCFTMLFRRGKNKKGFVVQRTDNGQLSISIRAMENLVHKCIEQHDELHIINSHINNTRDGVVVNLRIGLANGVSIPLAVNALQKQIKQYIQACSGIDVKEVRVQVETANAKANESPFMVHESLLKVDEADVVKEEKPLPKEEPVQVKTPVVEAPKPVAMPVQEEPEEDEAERKPLHQRLFGRESEPVVVPMPPQMSEETPAPDAEEVTEAGEQEQEQASLEAEQEVEADEEL